MPRTQADRDRDSAFREAERIAWERINYHTPQAVALREVTARRQRERSVKLQAERLKEIQAEAGRALDFKLAYEAEENSQRQLAANLKAAFESAFPPPPPPPPVDLSKLSPSELIEMGLRQDRRLAGGAGQQALAQQASQADLSNRSPSELIHSGLGGQSLRRQQQAALSQSRQSTKPLPDGWESLSANDKILLALQRESGM